MAYGGLMFAIAYINMTILSDTVSDVIFNPLKDKPGRHDCCSQPFGKPNISERTVDIVSRLKGIALLSRSHKKLTLEQSKQLLKKLAKEMNRISKPKVPCLVDSIEADCWSLDQCRTFILKWAEELKNISTEYDTQTSSRSEQALWQLWGEEKIIHSQKAELKEAHRILYRWAASLKSVKEDSVHPSEDVRGMLEDLGRQWKRGHLANMLPAMDFIMWSVLQDTPAKTWKTRPTNVSSPLSRLTMVH